MKRFQILTNKKIIGAIVSIVLVMTTALGVTMAYYKDETGEVVNQFSVGNVTTELVEDFYQNPGSDTDFTKTPRVTNTGANDCLVRIRVSITPESIVGREVTINGETKPYLQIYTDAAKTQEWEYNATWENDSWEYKDGWYYYKGTLTAAQSTPPLFSTVVVNYDENNAWEDFDIILYHEAVLAEAGW